MASPVESVSMTPVESETLLKWKCRHCKHRWPVRNMAAIKDKNIRPKQCPNRDCRAMDWDRKKVKEGRPRKRGPKPHRKGKRK